MRQEVDGFISEITALGEVSRDTMDFESKFAASGLSERFNALLMKCAPVPVKMTKEEKEFSKQTMNQILAEEDESLAEYILKDAVDTVMVDVEEEMISQRRKKMIEDGVYDEYVRTSNKIDSLGKIAGIFRGRNKR